MKQFFFIIIAICCYTNMYGQHINRNYDDVSMSEVLCDLNQLSRDYNINFLYNELEDFRVSTHIKHKSFIDAVMQIVGFYPIRVVKRGEYEIYVECVHKTERHLSGTIIKRNT